MRLRRPKAWRRGSLALVLGLAALGPARATPPDIVNISDQLFGLGKDAVLVLRSSRDNLGLYDAEVDSTALVAIDRQSGAERIWPVYRTRRLPDLDAGAEGTRMQIRPEPIAGAVNPYDILQELQGRPISWPISSPVSWHEDFIDRTPGALHQNDGMVSVSFADGLTYRRPLQEMLDSLAASQTALAENIPDYARFGPLRLGDLLSGRQFTPAQCDITDPIRLEDRSGAPPAVLVRLRCEDEPDGQSTALLVTLLPAP